MGQIGLRATPNISRKVEQLKLSSKHPTIHSIKTYYVLLLSKSISTFLKSIWGFIGPMLDNRFLHALNQLEPGGCDTEHWSAWSGCHFYGLEQAGSVWFIQANPMTDPNGAAMYGVPWIPSIYPQLVSIYTSTMDSYRNRKIYRITCFDWAHISGHFQGD
jgi:hypothetical protein